MPKCCNTQDKLTSPRFLLARLYLNLLLDEKNEKRVRILGARLQSGSGAYDSVYDETMKRIEQQGPFSRDLAKRILGWVTFSARPLTAVELQNAIAVEIGEPLFDETNITDIEEIILVCSGLVVVEANSNTAKLVHFTTQEYLKRTFKSWFPNVHSFLTDTCLTYLSFDNFDSQEERHPFYQYSAHGLRNHLCQSVGNDSLLLAFVRNDIKVSRFMREILGLSRTECSFTGLHFASLMGLEHTVEGFSRIDNNFDAWDYLGRTPLTWAAGSGNVSIVRFLLDHGSNPNSVTKQGFTPLFYAAAYGHVAVVENLIDGGADVNFQNPSNETPIFFAAKGGSAVGPGPRSLWSMGDHALVTKLLLDAGADADHENNRRVTPLYFAAENGHEEAVKILLERSAKVNYESQPCSVNALVAPLAAAARKGHARIIILLLESGAHTSSLKIDTNMPPYFDARFPSSRSGIVEDESSFAAILKDPANPRFQDEFKRVPLHWAASRGDSIMVWRILEAGCNPNPKDIFGRTPLFAAVCRNSVNVVRILLDHCDIDAESEDKLGFTPLLESYRRQISPNNPFAFNAMRNNERPWEEVTNLLKAKTGLREESLPTANALFYAQYLQQQQQFYKHCDVCLDTSTLLDDKRQCNDCSMITQKDGTSGGTVTYCKSCIQGAKHCPLCGQSF